VAVSDPLRPQDPARIGIAVRGSVRRVTYAGPAPGRVVAESDSPVNTRYTLTRSGDEYLISAEAASR
jgi:hypothetical protein